MKIIVCVDNKGGVMFNRRRQSQDRVLREHILEMTSGHALWMNSYSAKMFGDHSGIIVTEDFLDRASEDDFCFIEDVSITGKEHTVKEIILFRWNRTYPADVHFNIPAEPEYKLTETCDFAGSYHEKITKEVYVI